MMDHVNTNFLTVDVKTVFRWLLFERFILRENRDYH